MAYNSETGGSRGKQTEIWDSERLATHIWGIFDLVVFKVILGSLGALVSKWPGTPMTGCRAKQTENWESG